MEPGTSGGNQPPVARCLRAGGVREDTPGEALERRGVLERRAVDTRRGEENGHRDDQTNTGQEQDAWKYEEELDPGIQEELEHLNQASDEINKLELQLDDARSSYRRILTDSARKLNAQGSQLGACIEKARPYHEARRLAKEAQQETQKAAVRFERAVSMHTAAREMVSVAEQGLLADKNSMDPTWQEMLNHATAKVNEAEEERLSSEAEHQRVTKLGQDAEARVQTLHKALKKIILKSKPYFELKSQFNHILEEHKARVVQLEKQVAEVKKRYSEALRNLEQISEQIHAQRGQTGANRGSPAPWGGRSSPVGAEARASSCLWADGEKTRLWVERHRESGWGQDELRGAEHTSVISLQTIASGLHKWDSVEPLGDLSDTGSGPMAEEWQRDRGTKEEPDSGGAGGPPDRQEASQDKQHHRSVSL